MKIAIDISKLSQGCYENSAKTGIYRYTSELLNQLFKHQDLEIALSSHNFPHAMDEALAFLKNKGFNTRNLFNYSRFENNLYTFFKKHRSSPFNFQVTLAASLIMQSFKSKSFSESFDIYHTTYFPIPKFIQADKTQRFITIHDLSSSLFPEYCTKNQIKRNKKIIQSIDIRKDWVVAVSEWTKTDLCNYTGISADRVFVTHLGADRRLYYPTSNNDQIRETKRLLMIPKGEYFLSLSTIEPRKNLHRAIRCFKEIITEQKLDNVSYVLVGNKGWKTEDVYHEIQQDPVLKKKVLFTGYVPDNYLSALYSGALAFIYPSFYEGFGIPPLEAMQCGVPVISSNTSSLPEVVGDSGIMIDPTDEDALCQAMIDIVKDKNNIRSILSTKGIERAKRFSWEQCAEKTLKAYQFALENK